MVPPTSAGAPRCEAMQQAMQRPPRRERVRIKRERGRAPFGTRHWCGPRRGHRPTKAIVYKDNEHDRVRMGLLQLAAYGAQDVYLSGNPKITFFRTQYRRHTNFKVDSKLEVEAATKIQKAWRRHDADKKRKAVAVIERHVLHHLCRPGGRLAPVCFSSKGR